MFKQSVLILVVLLYLYEVQRTKKVTSKDAAMLLFFAYQLYQTFFRVEHLSAADGFTTDIDKEAYTNLHKIVSELYKNDTLTIPGHLHVKGNLHVGDAAPAAIKAKNPNSGHTHIQGNLQVGDKGMVTDSGSTLTQGAIYGDYVRSRHYEPNSKIDPQRIDIGWTDYLHLRTQNIYPNYGEKNLVYHHGKHAWHDEVHFKGPARFNNWAEFKNRVKMSWIPDNSKQGKRIQEKGELFRDGWNIKVHH
jgi:hypothetical protein